MYPSRIEVTDNRVNDEDKRLAIGHAFLSPLPEARQSTYLQPPERVSEL